LLSLPEIPTSTNILTVTLATPFVEIISSEFTGAHQRLTNAISGGLVGPSTIGLLWVIIVSLFLPDQPTGAPLNIADLLTRYSGALYFIALFFAHGAAAFPLLYGFKSRDATNEAPEDLAWLTSEARSPQYFASLTNGGAKIAPPRKALILRGVDDEAGLVLAAASIGTKILSLFMGISLNVTKCLFWLGVAIAALGVIIKFVPALAWLQDPIRRIIFENFFLFPPIAAAGLFYLLPILSGAFKCVYGRELFFGAYFCEIKSASAPDADTTCTTITLPPTAYPGLRHGLYNHEATPLAIAKFVKLHVGGG
jgi:hypothetical protein